MTKIKPVIFGISGTSLTKEEEKLFIKNPCSGFILFSRNIKSSEQLLKLTKQLHGLYPERDIPILVDQEGGRVARIKPPIAGQKYPAAEYFANLYQENKEKALIEVKDNYYKLTKELGKFGINSSCSPVCDIRYKGASDVIGDRSFGEDVNQVTELAKAAIAGIKKSNSTPIIKHIPGHGRAKVDSHHKLPIVDTKLDVLEKTDFKVFGNLAEEKNIWAMTAHIIYKAIDSKLPATISKKVIDYIRDKIGFKGTLITDDICMHALHDGVDDKDFPASCALNAKKALDAGCDFALHCSGNIDEMSAICDAV